MVSESNKHFKKNREGETTLTDWCFRKDGQEASQRILDLNGVHLLGGLVPGGNSTQEDLHSGLSWAGLRTLQLRWLEWSGYQEDMGKAGSSQITRALPVPGSLLHNRGTWSWWPAKKVSGCWVETGWWEAGIQLGVYYNCPDKKWRWFSLGEVDNRVVSECVFPSRNGRSPRRSRCGAWGKYRQSRTPTRKVMALNMCHKSFFPTISPTLFFPLSQTDKQKILNSFTFLHHYRG